MSAEIGLYVYELFRGVAILGNPDAIGIGGLIVPKKRDKNM